VAPATGESTGEQQLKYLQTSTFSAVAKAIVRR